MANQSFRIGVAQTDCVLGDVDANLDTAERVVERAATEGVDLLAFCELSLTGYAVGSGYADAALRVDSPQIERLKALSRHMSIVVGFIEETDDVEFFNSAMYLSAGEIRHVHRKVYLPNYRVFDERRYFGAGWGVWAFDTPWTRMAILVCGDAWHLTLPYLAVHDGANVLINIAASSQEGLTPTISCRDAWMRMNQSYALTLSAFVAFSNRVGSEGDLHFWGGSHIVGPDGNILTHTDSCDADLIVADIDMAALRKQRQILPFRRDDSLALTVDLGRRLLRGRRCRRGSRPLRHDLSQRQSLLHQQWRRHVHRYVREGGGRL